MARVIVMQPAWPSDVRYCRDLFLPELLSRDPEIWQDLCTLALKRAFTEEEGECTRNLPKPVKAFLLATAVCEFLRTEIRLPLEDRLFPHDEGEGAIALIEAMKKRYDEWRSADRPRGRCAL